MVQVSSGGQFIAVAVSPESAGQTTSNRQLSGKLTFDSFILIIFLLNIIESGTVASGAATASTDEDDGQSGFDDFATAAYTNGGNSQAMYGLSQTF